MDQGKPSSSDSRSSRRPRSTSTPNLIQNHALQTQHTDGSGVNAQNAALLAQIASVAGDFDQTYSSMLSQGYYPSMALLPGFYGNFLHRDNMPPPQSLPPTTVNFPWHTLAAGPHSASSTNPNNAPQASSSTSLHPSSPSFLDSPHSLLHPSDATTSNLIQGQQARASTVASHNSSSPEVELTEAERGAASDEKRRRNTAASARFRIKKKHKTITLERTVSDLTGRAEELEREVGDLRRENGWLKEIVMLKGTHNIANNRLALRQAVALATGQQTLRGDVSEESSSAPSEDETPVKQSKGKQKSGSRKS